VARKIAGAASDTDVTLMKPRRLSMAFLPFFSAFLFSVRGRVVKINRPQMKR
jgi:hypothetical protein